MYISTMSLPFIYFPLNDLKISVILFMSSSLNSRGILTKRSSFVPLLFLLPDNISKGNIDNTSIKNHDFIYFYAIGLYSLISKKVCGCLYA